MKVFPIPAVGILAILLAGCVDSYDRLARKMMFDSYRAGGTQSLADVSKPAEELYYLQKYGASAAQRQQAVDEARRYLMRQKPSPESRRPTSENRAKTSQFIAVPVERSARSLGRVDVMLFDTKSRQLVGNEVYDLKAIPPAQTDLNFETHTAQYVGGIPEPTAGPDREE